ncbi:hypothetical protein FRC01_004898 [Tulasnella sp. 417]|nr:hypothetical protein FRC01_004898 [Tulasnella sp. 417]
MDGDKNKRGEDISARMGHLPVSAAPSAKAQLCISCKEIPAAGGHMFCSEACKADHSRAGSSRAVVSPNRYSESGDNYYSFEEKDTGLSKTAEDSTAPLLQPPAKDLSVLSPSSTGEQQGSSFGSDTGEKTIAHPSEPRWSSRPSKHRLVGFLPTVAVLVTTLGFVIIIASFLLGTQYGPAQGGRGFSAAIKHGYFVLKEDWWNREPSSPGGHLALLVLSAFASHLISDTSSVLMALIAYRIGARWLAASREDSRIAECPTPEQYGRILQLMGSSSIMTIGEGCVYAAQSRTRPRLPRLFKQALGISIIIWVLARLVGLADLWLHATSKAILISQPIPDTSDVYMFAAQFNDTICQAPQEISTPPPAHLAAHSYPCFQEFANFVTDSRSQSVGFGTITNDSSSAWRVITLSDEGDLAIIVPGPGIDTRNTSHTVSTFGIRADCTSLNSLCARGLGVTTTNCSQAGYPKLPYFEPNMSSSEESNITLGEIENLEEYVDQHRLTNYIFGIVDGELVSILVKDSLDYFITRGNPADMAVQLRWNAFYWGDVDRTTGRLPDLAIDFFPAPALFANCSVSFFNVTARLDGAKNAWTLIDLTPSSSEFATTLWLPTLYQYPTEHLVSNLFAIAIKKPKGAVMAALNQHLARVMLGAAAGYFAPAKATDVDRLVPTLFGQYPIAPLLTFIALLCLYALLALLVFLLSWWTPDQIIVPPSGEPADTQERSMLSLTQKWLTIPIPLVGAAFPSNERRDEEVGVRSVERQPRIMVSNGNRSDVRLGIGLTNGGFGIWERVGLRDYGETTTS